MAKNFDGFLLPDEIDPEQTICVQFEIPNELNHIAAFWGALNVLEVWSNWDRDPEKKGKDVAAVWRRIIQQARASSCEGSNMIFDLQQVGCAIVLFVNGQQATSVTLNMTECPQLQGPEGPQGPQGIPGESGIPGEYIQDIRRSGHMIQKQDNTNEWIDVFDLCEDYCSWSCEYVFIVMGDSGAWHIDYGYFDDSLHSQVFDNGIIYSEELQAYLQFNDQFSVASIDVDFFIPNANFDNSVYIQIKDRSGNTLSDVTLNGSSWGAPGSFTLNATIINPEDNPISGVQINTIQEFETLGETNNSGIFVEAIRMSGPGEKPRYDDGAIDRLICPEE